MSSSARKLAAAAFVTLTIRTSAQNPVPVATTPATSSETLTAVRAEGAPVIDGSDADAVWKTAKAVSGFRVFDPVENGEPTFRTELRAAYDSHALYFFVRAFDPDPSRILPL